MNAIFSYIVQGLELKFCGLGRGRGLGLESCGLGLGLGGLDYITDTAGSRELFSRGKARNWGRRVTGRFSGGFLSEYAKLQVSGEIYSQRDKKLLGPFGASIALNYHHGPPLGLISRSFAKMPPKLQILAVLLCCVYPVVTLRNTN